MYLGIISNFTSLMSFTGGLTQNTSRFSQLQNSDFMLEQYVEGFHKQQNEGSVFIYPLDYKNIFVSRLQNKILVDIFIKEISNFKGEKYIKIVMKNLRQFKEQTKDYNELKLICRICEQVIHLNKFIVGYFNNRIASYRIMSETCGV